MRPITGAELTLDDGTHLTLLCETRQGYTNLCRLITSAHWRTRRWAREGWTEPAPGVRAGRRPGQDPLDGQPSVTLEEIEHHAEGLVCLSGCARDGAVASRVEAGDHPGAAAVARRLLRAFGPERLRIELQRPFARNDRRRNRLLGELAERLGVPCVATGNVHVHAFERVPLQDAMVAVRLGATLDESEPRRRGNSSHVLAPPERMAERFREHPGRRGRDAAGWPSACGSTSPRTSATATPARRTRPPTGAWPSCAGRAWTSATAAGASARRPRAGSRRSCA